MTFEHLIPVQVRQSIFLQHPKPPVLLRGIPDQHHFKLGVRSEVVVIVEFSQHHFSVIGNDGAGRITVV